MACSKCGKKTPKTAPKKVGTIKYGKLVLKPKN